MRKMAVPLAFAAAGALVTAVLMSMTINPLSSYAQTRPVSSYAEDRAAIEDLQARYLFALDFHDPDLYVSTFTEDGVLDYGSGEVWALKHAGTNVTQNLTLFHDIGARISGFGVDPSNGDPLYCALRSGDNSVIQRIISTNTAPIFTGLVISGDNIIFTGTNGPPGGNYYVLTSTNLLAPGTNWSRIATNSFDSNGSFSFTNSFNLVSNLFYRLQVQ